MPKMLLNIFAPVTNIEEVYTKKKIEIAKAVTIFNVLPVSRKRLRK